MAITCDSDTLHVLRGSNASEARVALALSNIEDRDDAKALVSKHSLLPDDHPLFDDGEDICTASAQVARWALSPKARDWLASLRGRSDVEDTLLWIFGLRTGLPLGDAEFDPALLRRKKTIPILTLGEMSGIE